LFEIFSERIEARLPEVPHLLEPGDRGCDRLRIDVAAVNAAVALANEQTRIFATCDLRPATCDQP